MNIAKHLFNWLTGQSFNLYLGGGGGGGSQQSTNTTYQTNIPEYAKPYVETMLGATQKQLFQGTPTEGGGFDITGFQPYKAYGGTYDASGNQTSYDPGKSIAGFQPMQQQAMSNAANMQSNPETFSQGVGGYMSPFAQYALQPQLEEASRQSGIQGTQQQAQATQAGAFGGGRDALMRSERERNLGQQQSNIMATGMQNAFNQAQQQYNTGFQQNLGINALQAQYGSQQQALEQQKANQAVQDYSNAQQYPLMQLGTMSNMIRGLPMQAQTTQQYVAAPNNITQAIGAAGAGASLYNAFKGAEGGLPREFKKSGIMSYNIGGEIESDLYNMDESNLQKQLKESSSPSVKRMAQRILRERQLEKQPQQPRLAGGGIVAFKTGNEVEEPVKTEPTSSEILQQRVMQAKPTGDVMAQPQGIVQAAPPPAPKAPLTLQQAVQTDPDIDEIIKGQASDLQTRAARSISDIRKEKQAEYEAAGVAQRNPEVRANMMKELANAEDEAKRNRHLQAAAFFARWGSTPGETLSAGLIAVRERIPEIIEGEKEAKKIRMEINKSIASLDEATRLETIGQIDAAAAVKEKDAEKMQALFFEISKIKMQDKKEAAAQKRLETREDAALNRMESQEELKGKRMQTLQDSVNATQLAGERIRAAAAREGKEERNETNMIARLNAAAQLQANVEKTIEVEMSKPAYATLVTRAGMAETPDTLPLITAAKEQLALRERNFNTMRKNAQDTVDFVREKAGMKPKPTNTGDGGAPPPPPGAKVD